MSHLMICLRPSDLRDLIQVQFISYDIDLVFVDELSDLRPLLELFPHTQGIITQSDFFNDEGNIFKSTLENLGQNFNLYVIDEKRKQSSQGNIQYYGINDHHRMILELKVKLDLHEASLTESLDANLVSMPSHLFLHFDILPFDLYLKINQDGADKFVKRIPAFEIYTPEILENYINKGSEFFFFDKKNLKRFSQLLISQLEKRLIASPTPFLSEQLRIESEVFTSSQDIIQSLGLNPKVFPICELAVKNIHTRIKDEKDLKKHLNTLMTQSQYQFQYSLISLTSLLCAQIVFQKELSAQKRDEILLRLVFASFFCDMTLTNPKAISCRTELDLKQLSKDEQPLVLQHAKKASQMLEDSTQIPSDVLKIILQHHGTMNGLGFSVPPVTSISPLSAIFIVAQTFAVDFLKTKNKEDILIGMKKLFRDTVCSDPLDELILSLKEVSA